MKRMKTGMKIIGLLVALFALPAMAAPLSKHEAQQRKENAQKHEINYYLRVAAGNEDLEDAKNFIRKNVNVGELDEQGQEALTNAINGDRIDVVKFLIEQKRADFNASDTDGKTPLIQAVMGNNTDIVKYLVEEKEADVNVKTAKNETPLMLASIRGNVQAVDCLAKHGANVDEQGREGNTALMLASQYDQFEVMKYLVEEQRANVNVKNDANETALFSAAGYGNLGAIDLLARNGADLNVQNKEGRCALTLAIKFGGLEAVEALVRYDADVSPIVEGDKTVLIYALKSARVDVAKYLLDQRYDIVKKSLAYRDNEGKTALMYAAGIRGDHEGLVRSMVEAGDPAIVHFKSYEDLTAEDYAVAHRNERVVAYLHQK